MRATWAIATGAMFAGFVAPSLGDDAARLELLRGERDRWQAEAARADGRVASAEADLARLRGMRDHLAGRTAADRTGDSLAADAREMQARAKDEGLKALTATIGIGFDLGAGAIEAAGNARATGIARVGAQHLGRIADPLTAQNVRLATTGAMKAARDSAEHAARATKVAGALPEIARGTAGAETPGGTPAEIERQAAGLAIETGRQATLQAIELLSSGTDVDRARQKTEVKLLALTAALAADLRAGKSPDEILKARGEELGGVTVEYLAGHADTMAKAAKGTPFVGQAVAIEQTAESALLALIAWRSARECAAHLEQNAGRYEEAFASVRNRVMALEIQVAKDKAAATKARAHAAGLDALAQRLAANPSVAGYPALTSLPGAAVPVPTVPLADTMARPAEVRSGRSVWDRIGGAIGGVFGALGSATSLVVYVGERNTGRSAFREAIAEGKGLLAQTLVQYGNDVGGRANLREEATERAESIGRAMRSGGGGGGGGSSGGSSSGSYNQGSAYGQLQGLASGSRGW